MENEFAMKTLIYEKGLPDSAKMIRKTVFQDEQGFHDEFDKTDEIATHFVMFDEDEKPIATCRVFRTDDSDDYILGRLAVCKEYRRHNIGSLMNWRQIHFVACAMLCIRFLP